MNLGGSREDALDIARSRLLIGPTANPLEPRLSERQVWIHARDRHTYPTTESQRAADSSMQKPSWEGPQSSCVLGGLEDLLPRNQLLRRGRYLSSLARLRRSGLPPYDQGKLTWQSIGNMTLRLRDNGRGIDVSRG